MEKYVIINADDYGLSPSVNRGVIEAHRLGTVTSATIMINMPGFQDGVELAQPNPNLGIGLHVNLTYGYPISSRKKVPSLISKDGSFSRRLRDWQEQEVQIEVEAQWQRARKAGLNLTHLDSHQGIHCRSKSAAKVIVALAFREKIPLRKGHPPLISPYPVTTDYLINDTYFSEDGLPKLINYLTNLKPGITEVMGHPGYCDQYVEALSSWTHVRERELKVFTDPKLLEAILSSDIKLIHYGLLRGQ